jgi:peptidoglycan/xylan/chitin deacetylase (PgdA/CDA1 family)
MPRDSLDVELKNTVRSVALHVARFLGIFAIARYLTRRRLRIVCYHGFSLGDEHEVAPHMFMRRETFERRMQILKRRVPVIALDEAVRKLQAGDISNADTVITLDDGWASNLTIAAPILQKFNYPACVYITTEHLAAGTEVFNVALYYMLYRAPRRTLKLEGLHPDIDGAYEIGADPAPLHGKLIDAAERAFPSLSERQQLLAPIACSLGLDLKEVLANDRFRLLDPSEIKSLHEQGVSIQLHTHTHRLPDCSFEKMAEEITRNREALNELLGTVQNHFCYPSGRYSARHPGWLKRLGILSATTCDPGLNRVGADPLQLKRYLDSEHFSDIAFEAEICGVRDLARALRARLRRR